MNLRVDDLLNAHRYYTTAAGRPNNRIQPTPLGGDQDPGNFGGGSRPTAFLTYQGGAADAQAVGPLIKAALCEIQNFHHPQYNPIRNGL
jgi:hypothetical protein